MKKIGILTFHYSNNYGGVIQSLSLYKVIKEFGYDLEIVNFVPSNYNKKKIFSTLGLRRNIFKNKLTSLNPITIFLKVIIILKYSKNISKKFDEFRCINGKLSKLYDENSIEKHLNEYDLIFVGSDQIWNPSQRKLPYYFLDFKEKYSGLKASYAADSTTSEVQESEKDLLSQSISKFDFISVRNNHTFDFVKKLIDTEVEIVLDPTLLIDFETRSKSDEKYILVYVLGKELRNNNFKIIKEIKKKYNYKVYSIKIPTEVFSIDKYVDKVFYDLSPDQWINMFYNASFVFTDSFHGVLFSMKFKKQFLAYYTEELRSSRFMDLSKRFMLEKHIISSVEDFYIKNPLEEIIDYNFIFDLIIGYKKQSINFIQRVINCLEK